MTTAEMLTRIRDLVDEDTAAYFDDADIRQSLNQGHKFTAEILYNKNKEHPILDPLRKLTTSIAYTWLTEPSDLWRVRSVILNSYPCRIRTGDRFMKEGNTYLAGTVTDPYFYQVGGNFDFDPTPTTGTYDLEYYEEPEDLTSTDPDIRGEGHEAVLQYAIYDLLFKQEKFQEAGLAFEKYNNMVNQL